MGGKFRGRQKYVRPAGEVVAERELRGDNGVVEAKIYVEHIANDKIAFTYEITGDGEPSSMSCDSIAFTFEVTGDGDPSSISFDSCGSLSDLTLAFQYLHSDVDENKRQLTFPLGVANASGFEWCHVDPDMNALCERIMAIEYCANNILYESVNTDNGFSDRENILAELSTAARLRHKIQKRVVALAREGRRDSPIFEDSCLKVVSVAPHTSSPPPLATDLLLRRDTGAEVTISVWPPRPNDEAFSTSWLSKFPSTPWPGESPSAHQLSKSADAAWVCEYQIVGLDQAVQAAGCGVDSLGALGEALRGIGAEIEKSSLWLGMPAEAGGWDSEAEIEGRQNWYGRYVIDHDFNRQIGCLMTVEVLRNRLLFDEVHNGAGSGMAHEEAILEHLREAEKIRFVRQRNWIDPVHRRRLAYYYRPS